MGQIRCDSLQVPGALLLLLYSCDNIPEFARTEQNPLPPVGVAHSGLMKNSKKLQIDLLEFAQTVAYIQVVSEAIHFVSVSINLEYAWDRDSLGSVGLNSGPF